MTPWAIPLAILAAIAIRFNTPILAFTLAITLFIVSVAVLAIVTYSKYLLPYTYSSELKTLIAKYYNKYFLYTSTILIIGLVLGSFYITTILYALASIVIYAIAESSN